MSPNPNPNPTNININSANSSSNINKHDTIITESNIHDNTIIESISPSSSNREQGESQNELNQTHFTRKSTLKKLKTSPDLTFVEETAPTLEKNKSESTKRFFKSFFKFILTPLGFILFIYGLNVIAWGGMLFLLLCNASPAMCSKDVQDGCNYIESPRRKWIEIDSQILTGLFCVPAFGFLPWRLRDLWYLLVWRLGFQGKTKRQEALRRLAGYHNSWFRLPGSENLPIEIIKNESDLNEHENNPSIPIPSSSISPQPITGKRAKSTSLWKMDFEVWCFVFNSIFQAVLCGFMWGYTRYTRPAWATGTFLGLGFACAIFAGIMTSMETSKIKKIEGKPSHKQEK